MSVELEKQADMNSEVSHLGGFEAVVWEELGGSSRVTASPAHEWEAGDPWASRKG